MKPDRREGKGLCNGALFLAFERSRTSSFRRAFTQEKLAELTDLNIRTVQKIEAGETNILITTAARIQKALACDWNKLVKF